MSHGSCILGSNLFIFGGFAESREERLLSDLNKFEAIYDEPVSVSIEVTDLNRWTQAFYSHWKLLSTSLMRHMEDPVVSAIRGENQILVLGYHKDY